MQHPCVSNCRTLLTILPPHMQLFTLEKCCKYQWLLFAKKIATCSIDFHCMTNCVHGLIYNQHRYYATPQFCTISCMICCSYYHTLLNINVAHRLLGSLLQLQAVVWDLSFWLPLVTIKFQVVGIIMYDYGNDCKVFRKMFEWKYKAE